MANETSSYSTSDVPTLLERVIECVLFSAIGLISIFGNISLWIIVFKNKSMKTTSNALILCLGTSDFVIALTAIPSTVTNVAYGRLAFSEEICKTIGYVTLTAIIASTTSIASISFNGYACSTGP